MPVPYAIAKGRDLPCPVSPTYRSRRVGARLTITGVCGNFGSVGKEGTVPVSLAYGTSGSTKPTAEIETSTTDGGAVSVVLGCKVGLVVRKKVTIFCSTDGTRRVACGLMTSLSKEIYSH